MDDTWCPAQEFVDLHDGAAYVGVSVDTLRRRVDDGTVPAWRLGPRSLRVKLSDLERLYQPKEIS